MESCASNRCLLLSFFFREVGGVGMGTRKFGELYAHLWKWSRYNHWRESWCTTFIIELEPCPRPQPLCKATASPWTPECLYIIQDIVVYSVTKGQDITCFFWMKATSFCFAVSCRTWSVQLKIVPFNNSIYLDTFIKEEESWVHMTCKFFQLVRFVNRESRSWEILCNVGSGNVQFVAYFSTKFSCRSDLFIENLAKTELCLPHVTLFPGQRTVCVCDSQPTTPLHSVIVIIRPHPMSSPLNASAGVTSENNQVSEAEA